tara:strand:+ start:1052 stop:1234 length:183 start_codon:yes stop_codon:yes gene_type:complete
MNINEEQKKLQSLVDQHNQTSEQITMMQSSLSDLRLQIAKQQGVIEALDSIKGKKKDAKT